MVALALCTSCVILPLSTTRGWVIYHNWVFDGGDGVWNRSCVNSLSNSYAMESAPIPSWRSPFRTAALPTEAAKSRHSTLQSTAPAPRRLQRSAMNRQREKQIIDSVLGASVYDRRIRPGGLNGTSKWEMVLRWKSLTDSDGSLRHNTLPPHLDAKSSTIVKVNIYLRSINDIDDYKMVRPVRLKNGRPKEIKKIVIHSRSFLCSWRTESNGTTRGLSLLTLKARQFLTSLSHDYRIKSSLL